jgi:hypothetical protein
VANDTNVLTARRQSFLLAVWSGAIIAPMGDYHRAQREWALTWKYVQLGGHSSLLEITAAGKQRLKDAGIKGPK